MLMKSMLVKKWSRSELLGVKIHEVRGGPHHHRRRAGQQVAVLRGTVTVKHWAMAAPVGLLLGGRTSLEPPRPGQAKLITAECRPG